MSQPWRIVILGLTITSSWGNGHATTYRGLVKELSRNGHEVVFLERDVPWYGGDNRDMPKPPFARTFLYADLDELKTRFSHLVAAADLVIVGSYVSEGVAVCQWMFETARGVSAFYDIDTPVTVAKLDRGDFEYLAADQVARFDLYLSFAGGPLLSRIRSEYGARRIAPFYCSFDPELYFPEPTPIRWDLGYLGTYSADRQPTLTKLLLDPARALPDGRFVVAGPQYPPDLRWPRTVERIEHIPPRAHRAFYNAQRYTLNVTRADMVAAGWSPSVRLFEAAGCGVPIISDAWPGLESIFTPGEEVLVARSAEDVVDCLSRLDENQRLAIGAAANRRVLAEHTAAVRARALEHLVGSCAASPRAAQAGPARPSAAAIQDNNATTSAGTS